MKLTDKQLREKVEELRALVKISYTRLWNENELNRIRELRKELGIY